MPGQQLNLLCIDGGGVKGLSALYVLRKLMEFLDPEAEEPPKPCDHFDMIGGTSTGGLIAIMLGRLCMTVDECIDAYLALQDQIFRRLHRFPVGLSGDVKGRYDHIALEEGVKSILRSKNLDEDTLLKNTDKMACRVFVTATSAGSSTTEVLTSYRRRRGPTELYNNTKIWEAARATSAASTFFEPISIGPAGRGFVDGGTGANNPVFVMWDEAYVEFASDRNLEYELNCLISVGCGIKSLKPFGESATALMRTLADIATETEEKARSFNRTHPYLSKTNKYFRFSAPSVGDISMDKPEEKSVIAQMTDHYIGAAETEDSMIICASKLPERENALKTLQSLAARQQSLVRRGRWSHNAVTYMNHSQPEHFDIFLRISQYDVDGTLERLGECKCPGTTEWILDTDSFCEWRDKVRGSCFILSGIIGSGKTTCTTTVVEYLRKWSTGADRPVYHFFYETIFQARLSGLDVLESFVRQMLLTYPDISNDLYNRVWEYYGPQSGRPSIESLGKHVFLPLASQLRRPIFVIDGVDECEQASRSQLLQLLASLVAKGSSLLITTRDTATLEPTFVGSAITKYSLTKNGVRCYLETFVSAIIKQHNMNCKITDNEDVLTHVRDKLVENAREM